MQGLLSRFVLQLGSVIAQALRERTSGSKPLKVFAVPVNVAIAGLPQGAARGNIGVLADPPGIVCAAEASKGTMSR